MNAVNAGPQVEEATSILENFDAQEAERDWDSDGDCVPNILIEELSDTDDDSTDLSYGDARAHHAASTLADMKSDTPIADGMAGAVNGRVEAVQRLPNEGLPAPRRMMDGVQRAAQVAQFVASGGVHDVTASDAKEVGVASAQDAFENAHPIEALKKAPKAVRRAADAAHVLSTVTDDGRQEIDEALVDLVKNKVVEGASSAATGAAASAAMRAGASAIPPASPLLIAVKGALTLGSMAVTATGALKLGYQAQDIAHAFDKRRDQSRHAVDAVDAVVARHSSDNNDEKEEPAAQAESQSWLGGWVSGIFGGSSGRSTGDVDTDTDGWASGSDSESENDTETESVGSVEEAEELVDDVVAEVEELAQDEQDSASETEAEEASSSDDSDALAQALFDDSNPF